MRLFLKFGGSGVCPRRGFSQLLRLDLFQWNKPCWGPVMCSGDRLRVHNRNFARDKLPLPQVHGARGTAQRKEELGADLLENRGRLC
eukprot:5596242-Amphidinium_carterae.1